MAKTIGGNNFRQRRISLWLAPILSNLVLIALALGLNVAPKPLCLAEQQ